MDPANPGVKCDEGAGLRPRVRFLRPKRVLAPMFDFVSAPKPTHRPLNAARPIRPRRALLSVSDKTGLVDLARALAAAGIELVSTAGPPAP